MSERETSAQIDAAAAEWAVRVDSAPLEPQEQAMLDAWLAGDARRLGAYARARAMFAHARRTKALGAGFDPDAYLATQKQETDAAIDTSAGHPDAEQTPPLEHHRLRRRAFLIGGSGAVAAGLFATLGLSWQAAAQTYSTKRGEIRLVPLDDGSTMTLNTASTARVSFSDSKRQVELVEGEALFDVAKDAGRPFVVTAGDTSVRAVGTSFTVSRLDSHPVQVLVREGVVEVMREGIATPRRVAANARAVITVRAPVKVAGVPPAEVSRELAWREGMLSFEDKPLFEAAAEFARYSDTRIRFADPAIGQKTVTGLFAANNPAGFARSAALSLGLEARQGPDGIILTRAD